MKTPITNPFGRAARMLALLLCLFALTGCGREKDRLDQQVRELCAKDGGIRAYETVKLPADKFNQWGQVNFYHPTQEEKALGEEYLYIRKVEYFVQGAPALNPGEISMKRTFEQVIRRKDMKILGEMVIYARAGGDLPGPWKPTSFRCPEIKDGEYDLFAAIFVKEDSTR